MGNLLVVLVRYSRWHVAANNQKRFVNSACNVNKWPVDVTELLRQLCC